MLSIPIMGDNYVSFFNQMPVGRASDSMMAPSNIYMLPLVGRASDYDDRDVQLFSWVGPNLFVSCLAQRGFNWCFSFATGFSDVVWHPGF